MTDPTHEPFSETARDYIEFAENVPALKLLYRQLGFGFLRLDETHAVAEMKSTPFTTNDGFFVGTALMAFTEHSAGLLPGFAEWDGESVSPATLMTQLNVNILSGSQADHLVSETVWVRRGRRQSVVETRVTDPDGRLVLQATSTHVPTSA